MIGVARTVALDTMCFIYLFEARDQFLPLVKPVFERIESGDVAGRASVLVLTETLVGALRRRDEKLADRYRQVFRDFPHLELVPISVEVADRAAGLRARYGLRTPDALHLACALEAGAEVFLTGDERLAHVAEIDVRVVRPEAR